MPRPSIDTVKNDSQLNEVLQYEAELNLEIFDKNRRIGEIHKEVVLLQKEINWCLSKKNEYQPQPNS